MISDTPEKRWDSLLATTATKTTDNTTLTLKGIPQMDTSAFQRWIMNGPLERNTSVKTIDYFEDEGRAVLAFGSQGARDIALAQSNDWIGRIPNKNSGITALPGTIGGIFNEASPVVEKLNLPMTTNNLNPQLNPLKRQ
eukprot:gnl/Chilomastix_caulleri/1481.p1 GENE.gnl/Chilomastix_caulleri/1481~~gnl/Chilomastix_caulleri/1481.p1  ORF type:complete len:139 (+),score=34.98 gnl/Chilomastix_caulleri/1481:93-509(+)